MFIRLTLLRSIIKACEEAFTLDNITSTFKATGPILFNPKEILNHFTIQFKTPTLPGSQSTNLALKTPYNLKQLENKAAMLNELL